MKEKKVGLAMYAILLICLAFTLGYLIGHGSGVTEVTVTSVPPEPVSEPQKTAETLPAPVSAPAEPTPEMPLDLNLATQAELELLPGIGPELAERILSYRQTNGPFVAKEQIMDVKGIGEKRYSDMEALITVGGVP